jgi:acetyl-CoA carboxylase biotin carboxyl carrier protein
MAGKKRDRQASSERELNLEELQKLIDVLAERGVTEFEMERNGLRLRFRRDRAGSSALGAAEPADKGTHTDSFGPDQGAVAANPVSLAPSPPSLPAAEPTAVSTPEDVFIIKSPIVGTFYGSPAPNAPPFVKIHDVVQVGQVLCIVEAMKLMNEIESEVAGEIVRVYIENGQPVEYGQPLFAIQPSHGK